MIKAFKKHTKQPWHKKYRIKKVYESRGKYKRNYKITQFKYKLNRKMIIE